MFGVGGEGGAETKGITYRASAGHYWILKPQEGGELRVVLWPKHRRALKDGRLFMAVVHPTFLDAPESVKVEIRVES